MRCFAAALLVDLARHYSPPTLGLQFNGLTVSFRPDEDNGA